MEVFRRHMEGGVDLKGKDRQTSLQKSCDNFKTHQSELPKPYSQLEKLKMEVRNFQLFNLEGSIQDRELKDHNWHRSGYGEISIKQGLASSSNIAVYKTMEKAFRDDAQAYFNLIDRMSYGKPDCIAGIANLKPAYFVTPKDSGWSDTAFAWFCIGYNQTITPYKH